ncbi:hypothetical protein IQ249_23770 [Lusitaniella coriacea LEGE 07157]|uniref:Predicted pPIWI-associating nuclease domain-containing protein n=1 Tax=Lusitaniella coriacea LEGE 07157 TaxID=945747 RepID=A0A8J7E024_9CYAN|nr:hypothetical protein [Lusitaniella coriacea]MBE9118911.1 hypothetical protein [Lusitaniella coriacea LEGE 07157]
MAQVNNPDKCPKGFNDNLNLPMFSQKSLKGISTLSDSLKVYAEQNKSIVDQVVKASDLRSSILEGMKPFALSEASRILANSSNLNAFEKIKSSLMLEQVNTANSSISKLLREVDSSNIIKLIQQTTFQSAVWKKQFQSIDKIADVSQYYALGVHSHLAEVSIFSALSQISLSHLFLEGVMGSVLKVELPTQRVLQRTLTNFAKSYYNLSASLSDNPASIISLPPVASQCSAVEFFNGVRVAESVTFESGKFERESELEEEIYKIEKDIQQETESILEELLARLDVKLVALLHGAMQSLESGNPDKVRHFSISLRELFTHVLHTLAPDDEVKSWSKSPELYDRGKPTRRARILYICHPLNHDQFSDFLKKDIDAVLEFLKLFQRGTHEIVPAYTNSQLKMMLIRMESALRFLLEIGRESNIL